MGLLWHFVSLDDAQSARRRQLLDSYGQIAQISALIPLLAVPITSGVRLLLRRAKAFTRIAKKEHQSPQVSKFPKHFKSPSNAWWSRLQWALDEQIVEEWGTRREWLVAGLWTVWLLVLSMKDTGDDYLHLTKRFGIVGASQLPMHYLLAAKSWSPVQFLTRMSHEDLNPYHRLLGRILIIFFFIHASMYLNFYILNSLLLKRIQDRDVLLGLCAITTFLVIGTTALAKVRDYSYRLFFVLHVVLSVSILPTLYFHVSHLRPYILEAALIYGLLIAQRNISQRSLPATLSLLSSESTFLLSVTIPLHASSSTTPPKITASALSSYKPGQHIYLSFPSPAKKLSLNPFTVASLPSHDNQLRLLIRPLSGPTKLLSDLVLSSKSQPMNLLIEGPYGSATYFPDFLKDYDRILLVAGGVGATFTLPIYRDLLQRISRDPREEGRLRFVWVVRAKEDAEWGIQTLRTDHGAVPASFELHISNSPRAHHRTASTDGSNDSIELQEREQLLSSSTSSDPSQVALAGVESKPGRPDLKSIVDNVFSAGAGEKVAVLVCGPRGMGKSARREVWRWVGRGREVWWHAEEFWW